MKVQYSYLLQLHVRQDEYDYDNTPKRTTLMRSDTYALIHSDRSRPRRRPSPRGGGGGGALPNLLKRSRRARRVPATIGSLRDGVGAEKISASGWDKMVMVRISSSVNRASHR